MTWTVQVDDADDMLESKVQHRREATEVGRHVAGARTSKDVAERHLQAVDCCLA